MKKSRNFIIPATGKQPGNWPPKKVGKAKVEMVYDILSRPKSEQVKRVKILAHIEATKDLPTV